VRRGARGARARRGPPPSLYRTEVVSGAHRDGQIPMT